MPTEERTESEGTHSRKTPRRSHRPLVDSHELILLQLYRTVSATDRLAIDMGLWHLWLQPPSSDEERRAQTNRFRQAMTSLKAGKLSGDTLGRFASFWIRSDAADTAKAREVIAGIDKAINDAKTASGGGAR